MVTVISECLLEQSSNVRRNERSAYAYANGNTFVGDLVNGKKEGYGCFTWRDRDRYERRYS